MADVKTDNLHIACNMHDEMGGIECPWPWKARPWPMRGKVCGKVTCISRCSCPHVGSNKGYFCAVSRRGIYRIFQTQRFRAETILRQQRELTKIQIRDITSQSRGKDGVESTQTPLTEAFSCSRLSGSARIPSLIVYLSIFPHGCETVQRRQPATYRDLASTSS
jgi:hypothetical protein